MAEGIFLNLAGQRVFTITENQKINVGRKCENDEAEPGIEDEYVSRQHCSVELSGDVYITDLFSKNGTFVNSERLIPMQKRVLLDGDFISIGRTEFIFRFVEEESHKFVNNGKINFSMKNTLGGRKLRFDLKKRGCIEYQLRMIEENPQLCIGEAVYVSSVERDFILCDIGSSISLENCEESMLRKINAKDFIENILKLIKLGEEHLLSRDNYVISPQTLFLNPEGGVHLIYLPCRKDVSGEYNAFSDGLSSICDFMHEKSTSEEKGIYEKLKEVFSDNKYDILDYLKLLYHFKDVNSEGSVDKKKERIKFIKLRKEYYCCFASFGFFICLFWMNIMNFTSLAAVGLILTGVNILLFGLSNANKSSKSEKKMLAGKPS